MNVTLQQIFNYIIKNISTTLILFLFGFIISIIFNLNKHYGMKSVNYVIIYDKFYWDKTRSKMQAPLSSIDINSQYLSIIDSTRLGYTYFSDLKKNEIINLKCEKKFNSRVLSCENNISAKDLEAFKQKNDLIITALIKEELNFNFSRAELISSEYNKKISILLLNEMKKLLSEIKMDYNIEDVGINLPISIFLLLIPFIIYINSLIFFFPKLIIRKIK